MRGIETVQYVGDREVDVVHALEGGVVERVERYRHAVQASVFQRLRFFREQRAVGGQREVERFAAWSAQFREHADQPFKVFAQQRFAACEP